MGLQYGSRIPTNDLVFLIDPATSACWNGSSSLVDLVGKKTMTVGANTVASNLYGFGNRHFSSSEREEGGGNIDTGYRFGGNSDKVVDSAFSWTVGVWLYKVNTSNPNNWWHVITDGNSGDIFTINESGTLLTSMNNGIGGSWNSGGDINYGLTYSQADVGWNLFTVVYDRANSRLKCAINTTIGSWQTGQVINPAYCIRNFVGWGSAQSSYHSDPSHSVCFAYQRVLTDSEIASVYNAHKTRFGK